MQWLKEEVQRLKDELAEAAAAAERERARHTAEQQQWEEKETARAQSVPPLSLSLHLLCPFLSVAPAAAHRPLTAGVNWLLSHCRHTTRTDRHCTARTEPHYTARADHTNRGH